MLVFTNRSGNSAGLLLAQNWIRYHLFELEGQFYPINFPEVRGVKVEVNAPFILTMRDDGVCELSRRFRDARASVFSSYPHEAFGIKIQPRRCSFGSFDFDNVSRTTLDLFRPFRFELCSV